MVVAERVVKEVELLQGQANLLTDFETSVLAAIAGTGGGKTMLCYWWIHSRLEAYPGNTWLFAEPTYGMLGKVILNSSDPGRQSLYEYLRGVGLHPRWISKQGLILGTDRGQIYLASADNPDSMQGAPVKGVLLDEAGLMSVGAYDTGRQRCSMMNGQLLLSTTPYNLGWLKTEVFDKQGKDIHVENWRSVDRPGFPMESYERERVLLPGWRFAMLYDGRFEYPAGLIYQSFDERACIVPRFEIPSNWLVHTGHDFGGANPAALFTAQDTGTGEFYHFREYLPGQGKSTYDHVQEFKKITKGYNIINRVGGSHQEDEIRQGYTSQGWHIQEPKHRLVEEQINKVIGMHRLNKIKVFSDLRNYLDEKRTFSRKLDEENKPTEKIENEARFHLMSAERYLMSYFTPETVTGGRRRQTSVA